MPGEELGEGSRLNQETCRLGGRSIEAPFEKDLLEGAARIGS